MMSTRRLSPFSRADCQLTYSNSDVNPDNTLAARALAPITSGATPARSRRRSELLPPSPADVADDVEDTVRGIYARLDQMLTDSPIPDILDGLRERCSSGLAVQAVALGLEAYAIQNTLLPRHYAFDWPAFRFGKLTTSGYAVTVLDFFQVLTGNFWIVGLLWSATSIWIPMIASFFFNLSARPARRSSRTSTTRTNFDPLIFNVTKAILAYVIYGQGYTFGFLPVRPIAAINASILGGPNGMLIGSYVGIVVALYEAAQGK